MRVLVDGAQSVGVLPLELDKMPVDAYAFTGHKWVCGPEGTGGLYVDPAAYGDFAPSLLGAMALDTGDPEGQRLWPDGRRFEGSTFAWPLYAGLEKALALHERWGDADKRFDRIRELARAFHGDMTKRATDNLRPCWEEPPAVGLVYLEAADPTALVRGLERRNLLIRTVPGTKRVRVSIHYLTTKKELSLLAETMTEVAGG